MATYHLIIVKGEALANRLIELQIEANMPVPTGTPPEEALLATNIVKTGGLNADDDALAVRKLVEDVLMTLPPEEAVDDTTVE